MFIFGAKLFRHNSRKLAQVLILLILLFRSESSPAYSVLTHEQIVDLLWKAQLRPMLIARFPAATDDEIRTAHAYAYGGCLIQDIGYYPFGNKFFSDLVHYVRSGDLVVNMVSESNDINEYAFALGALAHYVSDVAGHPAVNISVAETFPKLKAKYGPEVTYAENHKAHIRTEFGFDVAQVAKNHFTSQDFHDFIGFEVSKPLLQRAFAVTYGMPLEDVFPNIDQAIGTFRYSVSRLIPTLTRIALVTKKDEIMKDDPSMTRERFLYHLKTSQYQREWGRTYQEPNIGEKFIAFIIAILPKVGPLKTLDVKVPTPHTDELYMSSVLASRAHYAEELNAVTNNSLHLDNRDFDTGRETAAGEYSLTDDTYAQLLDKLADRHFAQMTPQLRRNILDFFYGPQFPQYASKDQRRWSRTINNLNQLEAFSVPPTMASR
jgi:Zinc dependent phospholipase C